MSEAQQKQYDRFLEAGYDPENAAMLVDRGAWLGTTEMTPEVVADVERYRAERDKAQSSSAVEDGKKGMKL